MNDSQEQQRIQQIEERLARIEQHLSAQNHSYESDKSGFLRNFITGFLIVFVSIFIILLLIGIIQFVFS